MAIQSHQVYHLLVHQLRHNIIQGRIILIITVIMNQGQIEKHLIHEVKITIHLLQRHIPIIDTMDHPNKVKEQMDTVIIPMDIKVKDRRQDRNHQHQK